MSISITVSGETIADCFRALGTASAAAAKTEELVEELRARLRPQGLVLNIDQAQEPSEAGAFGDENEAETSAPAAPAAPEPAKRGRGRPKNPAPETNGAAHAPATTTATAAPAATREQVIAALNEFATAHGQNGQLAARQAMQKVCGVSKLSEAKPEDYGKLLAHLKG